MYDFEKSNIGIAKAYTEKRINYKPAIHDYIELIYVHRGSGSAFCDGKEYKLKEGSLFLVFPNQLHSYSDFGKESDSKIYVVLVHPAYVRAPHDLFYKNAPVNPMGHTADTNLINLFRITVHQYLFGGSVILYDLLSALINKVLGYFTLTERISSKDTLYEILLYCQQNYKLDITAQKMSQDLYISKSTISKIFSTTLQTNFNTYVNSLRLEEARMLLRNTNLTIAEIATRSGFNSIRNFNHAFVNAYGISPREYVKTFNTMKARPE